MAGWRGESGEIKVGPSCKLPRNSLENAMPRRPDPSAQAVDDISGVV